MGGQDATVRSASEGRPPTFGSFNRLARAEPVWLGYLRLSAPEGNLPVQQESGYRLRLGESGVPLPNALPVKRHGWSAWQAGNC